jgi:GNAT superfamily N-acetyltransferase
MRRERDISRTGSPVSRAGPTIHTASAHDFEPWLALALEVEHLFGVMNGSPQFRLGLAEIIAGGNAFCIRKDDRPPGTPLCGGVAILPDANEIAWLAVAGAHRGKRLGRALLSHALHRLDPCRDIRVQTFVREFEPGLPARRLYSGHGFIEHCPAGPNAAGLPTVIMIKRRIS